MATVAHDHEGIAREQARKTKCSDCGKRLKPYFKATVDPLDWFFLECDTCDEAVCEDCSSVDDSGVCQCHICYESSLHAKGPQS